MGMEAKKPLKRINFYTYSYSSYKIIQLSKYPTSQQIHEHKIQLDKANRNNKFNNLRNRYTNIVTIKSSNSYNMIPNPYNSIQQSK